MRVLLASLAVVGVLASNAAGTPAEQCFSRLRALGASDACAWAWTYPWFDHKARNGDQRNAVQDGDGVWRPKPLEEAILVSPSWRAEAKLEQEFGLRPKFYYLDFFYVTGTYREPSYYAANRASMTAIVRKAWKDYGAVPVFSWHMEHPCVTNGFPKAVYRYKCDEHKDIVAAIVHPSAVLGKSNFRAWFEARLIEIAGFLNGLTDEKGAKIPVILRYAHEMDGEWFWWGKGHCSARDFVALERLEADFLRQRCGDGQVLFAYTPDRWWWKLGREGVDGYLKWYPGDAYVDVLGYDDYAVGSGKSVDERKRRFDNALKKLRMLTEYADAHGKVVILSESGAPDSGFFYEDLNALMMSDGVHVAFFNTWIGPWSWPKTEAGMADLRRFAAMRTIEKKKP